MSVVEGFFQGLAQLSCENASFPTKFKVFQSRSTAKMCLRLYIEHLQYYLDVSDDVLGIAYSNLLKFLGNNPEFVVEQSTTPRLALASIVTTSKYFSDEQLSLKEVAIVGGIHLKEYVQVEAAFLKGIGWSLSTNNMVLTLLVLAANASDLLCEESSSDELWAHIKPEENEICSELTAFFDFS